jgi:hypothetical protein
MATNRISRYRWQSEASPRVAVAAPEGFVVCPSQWVPGLTAAGWSWHHEILRIAYATAQANVVPSYLQRLFSNWN